MYDVLGRANGTAPGGVNATALALDLASLGLETDANYRGPVAAYRPNLGPYLSIPGFNRRFFQQIVRAFVRLCKSSEFHLNRVRDTPDVNGRWISRAEAQFLEYWAPGYAR